MSKADLRLDWCSYAAAKYAVEHWHYSRTMPAGTSVKIGAWEYGRFIGVVIFSRGANPNLSKPYGLGNTSVCELTRIALSGHVQSVTRIMSISIGMLRKQSPDLRLIVSFADPSQSHVGVVYQASNWVYSGMHLPAGGYEYLVRGKWIHTRSLGAKHGTRAEGVLDTLYPGVDKRHQVSKHRYLYPLDAEMRQRIAPLAKPYPKREQKRGTGETDNAPGTNPETGGASPTVPLLVE